MPRPLDEEKAGTILRSAITMFGEGGYAATTVKDIAGQAGLSTGTVYTYFADKEALFVAAVELVWQDFFSAMDGIFASTGSAVDKLSAISRMGTGMLVRLYPLARGMYEQANRLDLVHNQLERLTASLDDFLRTNPGTRLPTLIDREHSRFNLKVWLSGILFTLATVSRERLSRDVALLEASIGQALTSTYHGDAAS